MPAACIGSYLQGPFDTQQLPPVRFIVFRCMVVYITGANPAVSTADGKFFIICRHDRTVEVVHIVFIIHAVQFTGAFPPVIVIAADNYLFAGEGPDFIQIFLSILQMHGPGRIARNENRVCGGDTGDPILPYSLPVVFPARPEDIHRFFRWISR